jgi:hypothetical protein
MGGAMRYRIIQVDGDSDSDLTANELIGIAVLLEHGMGEPKNAINVYWRAKQKIQAAVDVAIEEVDA